MEIIKIFKNFMYINSQLDDHLGIEIAYPTLPSLGGWWSERQLSNSDSPDVCWYDSDVIIWEENTLVVTLKMKTAHAWWRMLIVDASKECLMINLKMKWRTLIQLKKYWRCCYKL